MYPNLYIEYLYHFHYSRDYFECHEVLEDHWKLNTNQMRESVWVGLIQLAVALYHYRRNNITGALKLISSSKDKLIKQKKSLDSLGIDPYLLTNIITGIEFRINQSKKYKSFDLPIKDELLLIKLETYARSINLYPNFRYNIKETHIINRHLKQYRENNDQ